MDYKQRILAFTSLGNYLRSEKNIDLDEIIEKSYQFNQWFTPENSRKAIAALASNLDEKHLSTWLKAYNIPESNKNPKVVALIMAGNIPLVGFHDLLSVLITGNKALVKMSSDDQILMAHIIEMLQKIEPEFHEYIIPAQDKLSNFDAVIATGSNNSNRYFDYYFSKYPNLLRKNRNSIAVIGGDESPEELSKLGHDIFMYFGLGCRNVSKIYSPHGFELNRFFEAIHPFGKIIDHHKYANNYIYHRSILLMNQTAFLDNNFMILKEDKSISSPMSVVNFEFYRDKGILLRELDEVKDQIQVIVSNELIHENTVPLGRSQEPALWDYADGADTLDFLIRLND